MTETTNWQTGLKQESIDKSVKMGDVLPNLKVAEVGDTVRVKIAGLPVKIKPKDKEFWTMVVEKVDGGGKFSMYVSNSLRYSLAVEQKKHGLETILGEIFVLGKQLADFSLKGGKKDTPTYYAQYVANTSE